MTANEKKLASHILGWAKEQMSYATCNDTDLAWVEHFSEEELAEMHKNMEMYNSGGTEGPSPYTKENPAPDFFYAGYLAHLLKKEAEGMSAWTRKD